MGILGDVFTIALMDPMVNFLVILDQLLFNSFGLAIIAFTIIIRVITFPLTVRQLHQTRAMQSLQPQIKELQKKFSDPKRRQEELMKAYKEAGVNPIGCLGPMLLQMPILIALFYAVRQSLALSPEALDKLSSHLYSWSFIQNGVPLEESFLGMDLRESSILMVVLVGATTWAQSKTTITSPGADDKAKAQQQMMMYMMPLMFMFFALSFPSGVSVYWVVTSVVSIGFNVVTYGFPMLKIEPLIKPPKPRTVVTVVDPPPGGAPVRARAGNETRTSSGKSRSKRKNRRRRS